MARRQLLRQVRRTVRRRRAAQGRRAAVGQAVHRAGRARAARRTCGEFGGSQPQAWVRPSNAIAGLRAGSQTASVDAGRSQAIDPAAPGRAAASAQRRCLPLAQRARRVCSPPARAVRRQRITVPGRGRDEVVVDARPRRSAPGCALLAAEPGTARAVGHAAVVPARAVAVMDRLRPPGGCPWDAEPDRTQPDCRTCSRRPTRCSRRSSRATVPALREELGDLLLQVVFHARVAAERGACRHRRGGRRHRRQAGAPAPARVRRVAAATADAVSATGNDQAPRSARASLGLDGVPRRCPPCCGPPSRAPRGRGGGQACPRNWAGAGRRRPPTRSGAFFSPWSSRPAAGGRPRAGLRGAAAAFDGRFRAMEKAGSLRAAAGMDRRWEAPIAGGHPGGSASKDPSWPDRRRIRPRDPRLPGQPDRRGRGPPRRRQPWPARRCPSGASTGAFEAVELRDGDAAATAARASSKAVLAVIDEIAPELIGYDASEQRLVDQAHDRPGRHPEQGRARRQRHPRRLAGRGQGRGRLAPSLPLFRYLGGPNAHVLPVPMMNILNGGAHADTNVDIQEFMIAPIGARDVPRGAALGRRGLPRAEVGAEGARAWPPGSATRAASRRTCRATAAALDLIAEAIEKAGLPAGRRHRAGPRRGRHASSTPTAPTRSRAGAQSAEEMIGLLRRAGRRLPDRLHRGPAGRGRLGGLEGADRRARRPGADRRRRPVRHQPGAARSAASPSGAANALLVKVNQIGTLTETLDAVDLAHRSGYRCMMSHRSGETEDTTIADLAVATELRPDQDRRAGPLASGWPSTTSCCGSRRSSTTRPATPVARAFPRFTG